MEQFLEPGDQLGIWDNKPREIQGHLDYLWNLIGRRWGEKFREASWRIGKRDLVRAGHVVRTPI